MKQSLPVRDAEGLADLLQSIAHSIGGIRKAAPRLGVSPATLSRYTRPDACPSGIDFTTYRHLATRLETLDAKRRPQRSRADQQLLERFARETTSAAEDVRAIEIFDQEHQAHAPSYVERLEAAVVGTNEVLPLIEYWGWVRKRVRELGTKVQPVYSKARADRRIRALLDGFLNAHKASRRDAMRARLSIYRSFEPLVEGPAGVELTWGELSAEARHAFVYRSLARERVLLERPHEEIRTLLELAKQPPKQRRRARRQRR